MRKYNNLLMFVSLALMFLAAAFFKAPRSYAANSYLPHWEHIPDGEPRLFEDPDNPGKYRVYIYGSHDTRKTEYCGFDLVTWSAPVEDLNDWRYEGVIFESIVNGQADVLFAPDVVEVKEDDGSKVYYLFPNNQSGGRGGMIAKSDSPKGPFEVCNWRNGSTTSADGVFGFDPAVFVDDDGRVYGYWGFETSNMAELNPETMCTVKDGCKVLTEADTGIDGKEGNNFRFFEASSIRKVEDKYVFIYSRNTKDKEFGLGASNCTLAYAYSDTPLGPWTYGGTIVDARGRETDEKGETICAQQSWGNTHGSILQVNGQWYVFYHRCIDNSMYSRQAMVEAIDVKVTDDGRVVISEAEVTSQGFEINGMNPYKMQTAGSACFITGGPQVEAHYNEENPGSNVINIKNGSIVGYKYLNFDAGRGKRTRNMAAVEIIPKGVNGSVDIMLDRPWESAGGTKIGSFEISAADDKAGVVKTVDLDTEGSIEGKHALFFVFKGQGSSNICDLKAFQFGGSNVTDEDEGQDVKPPVNPPVSTTDAPNVTSPSQPPNQTQAPAQDIPSQTAEPEIGKGSVFTVAGYIYKVSSIGKSGDGTVTLTGIKKKSVKSIKIPDTVNAGGRKFRVTAVGNSAFKGCKKASRVVIGKNVTQIGDSAFMSCKKLSNIRIKSKVLKKAGKNIFKGINKKAGIVVPKKQLAKYGKLLKSGQGVMKTMRLKGI